MSFCIALRGSWTAVSKRQRQWGLKREGANYAETQNFAIEA